MTIRTAAALALCVTAAGLSFTVTPSVRAQSALAAYPKVEVATIHRNKEIEGIRAAAPPGQGFAPSRLRVLPGGRLDGERFDIVIKADREDMGPGQPAGLLPLGAAALMRDFLAERFKLKVRTEKKERNIYELRMAKSDRALGPGLKPSDGTCVGIYAPPGPEPRCPFVLGGGRGFQAGHLTMGELGTFFAAFPAVNTTVVDKTELPGAYDVTMSAFVGGGVANATADDPRPSMFTAVEQMLGLKLERVRGSADVIVVERVERPTEN